MVAGKVEIESLSWQEGAESVPWECDGSTSFEIKKGKRKERGTDIILHVHDAAKEYLDPDRLQKHLDTHCKILTCPLPFVTPTEPVHHGHTEDGQQKHN